jgi:predicted phosphodiesterase
MSRLPVSDDVLQQTLDTYHAFDDNQTLAAEALDISRGALQHHLKQAALRGMMGTEPVLQGFHISKTTAVLNGDGDIVREFVQQKPERIEPYERMPNHLISGVSALVGADGNIIQQWIKTKAEAVAQLALRDAIMAEFESYRGAAQPIAPPVETYSQIEQYYPICDPHIGMLSWGKQTGKPNDLRIGTERLLAGADRLISLAPPAETAVIIQTGDFFHADNQRNVTEASGHQLDVDGRADKVKLVGVKVLRRMIDLALHKHEKVIVKNLKGNHDPESAAWLNISLGMFYENEPRVEIDLDDGNNDIWLHLFGRNYVGATHGHTMKPERMAMVMADDRPDYWGASDYRWMIFGHIHHETVKEVGSVRCESFRQPVPKDAYAHSHGYRAGSSMSSVTLHETGGEIGRHKINFPRSAA